MTRKNHMSFVISVFSAIAVSCFLPAIHGQQPDAKELTAEEAQAIAEEAYIAGYPIVENYKAMYRKAVDKSGAGYVAPFNVIKHKDIILAPSDSDIVTPNTDVAVSTVLLDLRTEPIVLRIPKMDEGRYYSLQLVDFYNYNFDYIGTRLNGNEAGNFMLAGPDWKGEKPDSVDRLILCETQFALVIYRTQIFGPDDVDSVRKIQGEYTAQPLSKYLNDTAPESAPEINFLKVESPTPDEFSFIETLNFALQFCPTVDADTELMNRLKQVGIVPSASFDRSKFSPEIQSAIKQGLSEGEKTLAKSVAGANSAMVFGSRDSGRNDFLRRAVAARIKLHGNSKEEQLNSLYRTDADGTALDATSNKYVLRIAKSELPPVNAFWSITIYDGQTQKLVQNSIDRYLINSSMLTDMTAGDDGQVEVFIQHDPPGEDKEANWLPAPSGPFYLVLRLYWPKPEAYEGKWTAPLVWSETSLAEQAKPAGAEATMEVKPSAMTEEANPEMERPSVWGEPTEVKVLLYIIDVDEVNSADQSFAASVFIKAEWKNPFLRHKGPGPMLRGITEVWNPRLTIIGQQMAWKSYPEAVEIQPDGTVTYRQKIWGRFSQPLDLLDFPLDQQELSIQIVAAGLLEDDVKMVPLLERAGRSSAIAPNFSLPDFDVLSWDASPAPYFTFKDEAGVAGYEMKIKIARQATYYVLKVIVPLCLIVIMSWLPRWIDPEQTGTNIGISTTAFLTLVAYLFAITVFLPKVSYVTRMDWFIILSTLTVFVGLIHTVANTTLIKKQKKELVEKIEFWSRFVYPVLMLFVLTYSFWL